MISQHITKQFVGSYLIETSSHTISFGIFEVDAENIEEAIGKAYRFYEEKFPHAHRIIINSKMFSVIGDIFPEY